MSQIMSEKRCGHVACGNLLDSKRRDYCDARCKRDAAYVRERRARGTKTPRKRRLATPYREAS